MTGPVFIDGAKPGDALKVTILSLRPSGWGWTGNIPGFGLLTDQFPDARLHHWHYDPGLTPAMYGPGGRVPLRPFTGTIGVAPAEPGLHSIIPPRNVGGNMDARDIGDGTELYLPVEVEGALFSVGDTHAAQGDGEVCGTAIESPIDVALKFELVKGAGLRSPRYVTPGPVTDHFDKKGYEVTTGIGPDLMAGARMAVSEMVELLSRRYGYSADRRLHAVQRLRRPAHQLDRRRAELGRLVLLPAGGAGVARPRPAAANPYTRRQAALTRPARCPRNHECSTTLLRRQPRSIYIMPMDTDILATDEVVDVLNDLLENSRDGEYGFRTCAEEVKSAPLKQLFNDRAASCGQAADELAH